MKTELFIQFERGHAINIQSNKGRGNTIVHKREQNIDNIHTTVTIQDFRGKKRGGVHVKVKYFSHYGCHIFSNVILKNVVKKVWLILPL
jgi:hypothetical protein